MLEKYFPLLKRVYRHYGYSGKGRGTIDSQEFWSLIKDIKLADKKYITLHSLYKTFYDRFDVSGDESLARDYELEASEFVVALVKIASLAFGEGGNPIPDSGLHVEYKNVLVSKFVLFMEEYVDANA